MNTTVSIIIPTFNRKALLDITLQNIFKQTLRDTEIIIVDDHSTDGTMDFLFDKYGNILTIIENLGKGPGAARNTGLSFAKGKYVQFFDSDDVMTINKLEVQYNLLETTGNDLAYCPYVYVYQDLEGDWVQKDVIIQHRPIPKCKTLHQCMIKGFFTIIPGFLFRKSFLEKLGKWREDLTAYEDWDFLWRIGKFQSNPLHTDECAIFYRVHQAQTTGENLNNFQRDADKLKCLSELYDFEIRDDNLTKIQKLFFQIFLQRAQLENHQKTADFLPFFRKIILKLVKLYLRIFNKIGRLRTKTNWQLMHGISNSKETFNRYKELI